MVFLLGRCVPRYVLVSRLQLSGEKGCLPDQYFACCENRVVVADPHRLHLFIVVLYMAYGYPLSLYALQVVYYVFCTVALVTSLSYMLSSIVVFFRDLNQIIGIILQFTMWLTPIVWDIKIIPASFIFILKLNPLFYIVQGFRDAFIERVWFWQQGLMSVVFLASGSGNVWSFGCLLQTAETTFRRCIIRTIYDNDSCCQHNKSVPVI
jgi:hypothetical protein